MAQLHDIASCQVSVIIPCFNLGQFVAEAVDSVLGQTLGGAEIIIVNDGSTDALTNEYIGKLEHESIRVVTSPNLGLAGARNLGLQFARGRYVCALDADDRLAPTFIERTTRILDTRPEIAFVSCWLETFGDEQWIWRQERCDFPTLLAECTVCTAALARTALIREVGGYDERMPHQGYEDWDLGFTMVERGFVGVIVPDVLFHYRRRRGSMSSVCCVGAPHIALMRYLFDKHRDAYLQHLREVVLDYERRIGELLRSNLAMEKELTTVLEPSIEGRRRELERLQRRLARVEEARSAAAEQHRLAVTVNDLKAAVDAAERRQEESSRLAERHAFEAAALRRSKSWRVTRPLRAAQDLLSRLSILPK